MLFNKFVITSENGVLVLRPKNGFGSFVLLSLRLQVDHKFGIFCHEWTANFPIFGSKTFTAIPVTSLNIA